MEILEMLEKSNVELLAVYQRYAWVDQ